MNRVRIKIMLHIVAVYLISIKTVTVTAVKTFSFYARKNHKNSKEANEIWSAHKSIYLINYICIHDYIIYWLGWSVFPRNPFLHASDISRTHQFHSCAGSDLQAYTVTQLKVFAHFRSTRRSALLINIIPHSPNFLPLILHVCNQAKCLFFSRNMSQNVRSSIILPKKSAKVRKTFPRFEYIKQKSDSREKFHAFGTHFRVPFPFV